MLADLIKQTRQNHALEHATVSLLLERGIRPPLGGYSTSGGFFILGKASTEGIAQAAEEALDRLLKGQRELAVSPHCGTNLVTGAILAAVVSAIILGRSKGRLQGVPAVAVGIIGATLVSRPLGNALQRRYTTLADVGNMEIAAVTRLWYGRLGAYTIHRVRTRFSTG